MFLIFQYIEGQREPIIFAVDDMETFLTHVINNNEMLNDMAVTDAISFLNSFRCIEITSDEYDEDVTIQQAEHNNYSNAPEVHLANVGQFFNVKRETVFKPVN